jgi:ubiquinone/menaquinone biosynthesis C-methylase UbiE
MPARSDERSAWLDTGHQEQVDRHFESTAQDWKTIYEERTVYGLVHQERRATALDWIDELALPDGASVLEIGCGAGLTSAALAERGMHVAAIDSAAIMIELTEQLARDRDLADRIHASVASAYDLPFPNGSHSLVLALGVLPWLQAPDRAMAEMARVVRPGGYVLTSVDNVLRLHYLLDPRLNPALGSLRRSLGSGLRSVGVLHSPSPTAVRLDSSRRVEAVMERLGLDKVRSTTIGFGPFTFWGRPVLSEPEGRRLHRRLQSAADRRVPLVRSMGGQYLILVRRPDDIEATQAAPAAKESQP